MSEKTVDVEGFMNRLEARIDEWIDKMNKEEAEGNEKMQKIAAMQYFLLKDVQQDARKHLMPDG